MNSLVSETAAMARLLVTAALLAAAFAGTTLAAQEPDGSANRAAIGKLGFMVGRWRGEAWMLRGAGERVNTSMTETVEPRLGGTVLLIEGRGIVPGEGGGSERVVHHALAILSFDPKSGGYSLRSHVASGLSGDFAVTLWENGVSWSREVPGGRIRNTLTMTNNEWHEIGEFSRDGTTWQQIMEMRLRKDP